jgi:WS/DGAT/MGAT family acyltransferase
MVDRLSPLDASFLYLEEATTPMHVGSLAVFEPSDDSLDYDRLVSIIRSRIKLVPRYRQRLRGVPARIANPVWVDDERFDVTYHVRRSGLPRPGNDDQLRDLVARIMSRRLDRDRPLWEMYLVEGLERNRLAIITKSHFAMVDGIGAVDIGQVILDRAPQPKVTLPESWSPRPEPTSPSLVAAALIDVARRPTAFVDSVRTGVGDLRSSLARVGASAMGLAATMRVVARPAPPSALNHDIGKARRFATADTRLDDYKEIRAHHGGTINDVVLAVVAGALRSFLMMRGEPVRSTTMLRALVPLSVEAPDGAGAMTGNRVQSFLVDLPVGESSPVVRLQRVSYAMATHHDEGQAVGADSLVALAGFAPPTLHALGARVGSDISRRLFNLVITNVPGPQYPLYAGGAHMQGTYPIVPLSRGQGVSIGLTSYDGGVYYGLNADRDTMRDVHLLAQAIVDALDELHDTVATTRGHLGHTGGR